MIRPPPIFTRTDTLVPDTTLVRSTQRSDYGVRTPRVYDFRSAERGYQKGGAAALGGNGRYGPIFDSRAPGNVALGREENVSKPRLVFGGIVSPDGYPDFVFYTRSEEHTSELQSLMRISYAVFCLKNKTQ